MQLLIDKFTIKKYLNITSKRNDDIIEQYIREAQAIDLPNLLCESYLADLISNPENYEELIKGKSYEYNGITYIHQGLEIVLAHLSFARYKLFGTDVDTPFGTVKKNNADSENSGIRARQVLYKYHQQIAYTYFQGVYKFLKRTNYNGFNDKCPDACFNSNTNFRLNVISK